MVDDEAAYKEGWCLADCGPRGASAYGPWQVQKIDEHEDPALQLESDGDAWNIIYHGTAPHHARVKEFLRRNNPKELDRLVHWALTGEALRNED